MAFLVVYVAGEKLLFVFISNLKYNQDFNETIKETASMVDKVLMMLLHVSINVNPAARLL